MKKGQVAIEYLMIVGFVLVVLIPGLVVYYNYTSSSQDKITTSKADKIAQEVVDAVDSVYYYGEGSQNTMTIDLPENVEYIYFEGKEMTIGIALENGDITEIVRASDVQMEGTIYNTPGKKDIIIKAFADKVVVNSIEEKIGLLIRNLDETEGIKIDGFTGTCSDNGEISITACKSENCDGVNYPLGAIAYYEGPGFIYGDQGDGLEEVYPIQIGINSLCTANAKDYLTLKYDDNKQSRVYLPAGSSLTLYVGSDGSTYYDAGLKNLAQETLVSNKLPLLLKDLDFEAGITPSGFVDGSGSGSCMIMVYPSSSNPDETLGSYHLYFSSYSPGESLITLKPMAVSATGCNIAEGGYIILKKPEDENPIKVYFPTIGSPSSAPFFIAEDGSTYTNAELTNIAKAAP